MMKPEDMTKEFIDRLTAFIEASSGRAFKLNDEQAPMGGFHNVTLLRRRGGYTKQPCLAGDSFVLAGAYAGKKHLVFTFHTENGDATRVAGPTSREYKQAEFTETDARANLTGFADWYDGFLTGEDVLSMAPEEPAVPEEELVLLRGDEWGSW